MPTVYEIVTDRIIEKLSAGTVPWRKPWSGGASNGPRNIRGNFYRGINVFLLGCQSYTSPYWLTYNQARSLKGYVRKGEKGSLVVYWKILKEKDKATGAEKTIPLLRYYTVFNLEQCDGIKAPKGSGEPTAAPEISPIEACEAIAAGYVGGPSVNVGGAAYYTPATDSVTMPPRNSFINAESYYGTLFHELGHSTGHASRLAREGVTNPIRFGSHMYSKEELVAEMTAAFLSATAGIDTSATLDNSASYIAGWLKVLRNDSKLVVTAAGAAQKAAELILGEREASEDSGEGEAIAA